MFDALFGSPLPDWWGILKKPLSRAAAENSVFFFVFFYLYLLRGLDLAGGARRKVGPFG